MTTPTATCKISASGGVDSNGLPCQDCTTSSGTTYYTCGTPPAAAGGAAKAMREYFNLIADEKAANGKVKYASIH